MLEQTHRITRLRPDPDKPVCLCGFADPDWFINLAVIGMERAKIRARKVILHHVTARTTDLPKRPTSPSDPFEVGPERTYPRAGVRRQPNGKWRLTLWDGPDTMHVIDVEQAVQPDRYSAFGLGLMIIGAHRKAGTRLNGRAVA